MNDAAISDTGSSPLPTELVITIPASYGSELTYLTRTRTTLGALTQLFVEAQRYIVIAAPFLQHGQGLDDGPLAISLRTALSRGVEVNLVSTEQGLSNVNIGVLRASCGGHLRLFQPRANRNDPTRLGSHAKFCLVDGVHAYVGSANLTGPGLSEHLEMGLLVHGDTAQHIAAFWKTTVQMGIFVEVGIQGYDGECGVVRGRA